ncbi:MAG: 30S ribosomal protein S9 [Candidatus Omnitrophica bacterium]|nr:30S ribosomal protein S9 [Candidatus Omnitrophota bacterium]
MPSSAPTSFYATGRRKQAIARVWIFPGQKGFSINGREVPKYLQRANLQMLVEQPLKMAQAEDKFRIRARVTGGGLAGQAGAVSLGIARALLKFDENLRSTLRRGGFLTRDPREKERKKFGRKGARRSFQYTKR